jgi:hypothetical protein
MLKPEVSLPLAMATAVGVYAVFQVEAPNLADVKGASPHNKIAAKSITTAGWTAAGMTAGVSLLAKDYTIFVVGGMVTLALILKYKHANVTEPNTGKVVFPPSYQNQGSNTTVGAGS